MLIAPLSQRIMAHALQAGPALVEAARGSGRACFAASLVEGPAVVLGRHQRAARVLDLDEIRRANVPVFRRRTAGTAAFAGGRTLVFTLALPRVTALFPDASFRTVLNRHVRPFLRGLTAAGVLSHYFGREWVSSRRRPVMLLGFDVEADGAVLVEAVAGFDQSFSVPPSLASGDERSMDRCSGQSPAALSELLPEGRGPEVVMRCVADAMAARAPAQVEERADLLAGLHGPSPASLDPGLIDLTSSDPVPSGAELLPPARIPVGWLERARLSGGGLWLGGDVLAPRLWLDRLARVAAGADEAMDHAMTALGADEMYSNDMPLEGVSLAELLEKARSGGD